MTTSRNDAQLLVWQRQVGTPMVRISGDRWRPAGIDAWFLVANLLVRVAAEGTAKDVRVLHYLPERLTQKEAQRLRDRPSWAALRDRGASIVPDAEEWGRVDVPTIATTLEAEAVVTYDRDDEGRVVALAYGSGPLVTATTIRRDLAGPEGGPRPGPKPKGDLEEVVDLYVQTASVAEVAQALGVSPATVYRRLAEARDAGLLPEEKK